MIQFQFCQFQMLTSNQSIQLFVADISVFPLSGRRDQQSRKAAKYIYSSTVSFSFSFSFIYLFYFVLFLLLKYNFLFIYLFYYFFYLSTILRYLYFYFLLLYTFALLHLRGTCCTFYCTIFI